LNSGYKKIDAKSFKRYTINNIFILKHLMLFLVADEEE